MSLLWSSGLEYAEWRLLTLGCAAACRYAPLAHDDHQSNKHVAPLELLINICIMAPSDIGLRCSHVW